MGYFLVLSLVTRHTKHVVREIVLRDDLLAKRRQSFFFIFLFFTSTFILRDTAKISPLYVPLDILWGVVFWHLEGNTWI
jgi:hypothetical protein